jgi:hypothetical protein
MAQQTTRPGTRDQLERAMRGHLRHDDLMREYLFYVIFPLWLAAGFGDYITHRISKIEETAGPTESLLHSFMLVVSGGPVLMGLLFEINSLVLATMSLGFFAHDVASIVDGYYALPRRKFSGAEQHIHSYMEGLPFMTASFAVLLYWRQFLAIFGAGPEKADWKLRRKKQPISRAYFWSITAAIGAFAVLPYGEELIRCLRAKRRRDSLAAQPRVQRAS